MMNPPLSPNPLPPPSRNRRTRLLVSVRSAAEAHVALRAGADVIDIKEPSRGSLGMAEIETIHEIVRTCCDEAPETPVSAALGEVREWLHHSLPLKPPRLAFAKLGLAGLAGSDWISSWIDVRDRVSAQAADRGLRWIAVIYADADTANSPAAQEVIAAAADTGCAGVLIDTWSKSGGTLLDHVMPGELESWLQMARERNLLTAVAGSLNVETLPDICLLPADLVAVRGAACRNGERTATICPEAISRIRQVIAPKIVIRQ